MLKKFAFAAIAALLAAASASAQEQVLNLYSARHYSTDEALYTNFTKATGIKINRVDADDAGILARLKAEGTASPADVILLVDASRLWKGEIDGLFQRVKSKVLDATIPAQFSAKRTADGGVAWFGFSTRARVIVYDKVKVKREDVDTYEKLADPVNKGKLCIRSGSHPYNLSLFGAMVEHLGPVKTEAWLQGLVNNMARRPKAATPTRSRAWPLGNAASA
jgi:iron(III) transport system substrate-binding protein